MADISESRRRVMVVYGTRPEAVKVAPVVRALETSAGCEPIVAVTGQHREMLDQVNEVFGIRPRHDLDLCKPGQTLTEITVGTLAGMGRVLAEETPDMVVVQGDTTTTYATALAAFYLKIPVTHLEAGLRTADRYDPFPEEVNRRLTSQLASLHLAPTAISRGNLLREGIAAEAVVVTGNTVIDALRLTVEERRAFSDPLLARIADGVEPMVLVTAHRRESWGEPMARIGRAVAQLAIRRPDLRVVWPLHRNPLVRDAVCPSVGGLSNVLLTEPQPYAEFCQLMSRATLILTDSGGVQEEGPSLGVPVLVMRDTTERPEAVAAGTVRLVGTDESRIVAEAERLLTDDDARSEMARAINPYGDGQAARRSVEAIEHYFGLGPAPDEFVPHVVQRTEVPLPRQELSALSVVA
jgi:UDP-N-acetylglucosamine 2-epimerase (non-hydrolysing)